MYTTEMKKTNELMLSVYEASKVNMDDGIGPPIILTIENRKKITE